jgi:hypothetical protein
MAGLEPYTSTYNDVDGSTIDASDLVNEFYRVAYYLNLWGGAIGAIGKDTSYETYIEKVEGELAEILPARGLIQRLDVAAGVNEFEVAIREHTDGAPFRVYTTIRCLNKDTRFMVRAPSGQSHVFGVNRTTYMPSQVIADGAYTAAIICTYGAEEGVMVQVFAANPEEGSVDKNDILQLVAQ